MYMGLSQWGRGMLPAGRPNGNAARDGDGRGGVVSAMLCMFRRIPSRGLGGGARVPCPLRGDGSTSGSAEAEAELE